MNVLKAQSVNRRRLLGTGAAASLAALAATIRPQQARADSQLAATGSPIIGRPGVSYGLISAVIRNVGAPDYWQPIEYETTNGMRYHNATGLDATQPVEITSDNKIQINYAGLNATAVSSLSVTHDNDMVFDGLTCGVSVQTDLSIITIARFAPYVDVLSWTGSTWKLNRGAQSPFQVQSFSKDGTLTIAHPDLGSTGGLSGAGTLANSQVALTARGPYIPVISPDANALLYDSFSIQFMAPNGKVVTTPDINCRAYIQRGGGQDFNNSLDARLVGLDNGQNIWIMGLMEV